MKILLIDNYDSFTYNLAQYIGEVEVDPEVVRNDEVTVNEVADKSPDAIIISPGPGTPSDAGVSVDVIEELGDEVPMLGVCLGHQCIAEAYGGQLSGADRLLHGKTSRVYHGEKGVYEGLPNPVKATRYHSLLVEGGSLPEELHVDALTRQEEIMGLHHQTNPLIGVQFHPESILTEAGRSLLSNFLDFTREPVSLGASPTPPIPDEKEDKPGVSN